MNKKTLATSLMFFVAACTTAHAEEPFSPTGHVCWPLHLAGITLGSTNDSQAQRLLGRGVFRANQGDTGGRYFIDVSKRATLHLVSYTDSVIGELTLTEGIDPKIQPYELKKASSRWFNPYENFGNWHQLKLGSTKNQVLENLGQPKKKFSENEWTYFTTCTCEIQDFFTVYFKDDRLFKIKFESPAG